ncbi:hypothetical protein GCM10010435_64010 [Winogradskya consettensis]|uniref:Uncharacterized protein n=1 Tax=Winogradskya consettensis TaxID=113560 RepID=A0A919T561_9ACTN|nr:hypothetical protein Aco04nite_95830 [Actinoplanes consettensis]
MGERHHEDFALQALQELDGCLGQPLSPKPFHVKRRLLVPGRARPLRVAWYEGSRRDLLLFASPQTRPAARTNIASFGLQGAADPAT